jgi:capsular polysaccharide biosynthesis protein
MVSVLARALLVVVVAAAAGAAALAFSNSQPKEYAADVQFAFSRLAAPEYQLLGPGYSEPQGDENVRIQTEAADVKSFDVAQRTAKAAPDLGYTAGQVAGHVAVGPVRDTLTVTITAKSSTPQRAARLANVYSQQYIKLRRARERAQAKTIEKALKAQFNTLSHHEKVTGRGGGLLAQINLVDTLRRVGSGEPQIIEGARASFAPASPNTVKNVLFGVVFGLVVGIGLVALRVETKNRSSSAARRGAVPARGDTVGPR